MSNNRLSVLTIGAYLVAGVAGVLALLLVAMNVLVSSPYRVFIVQSGSMEPTIATGALVLVGAQTAYAVGDVITFQSRAVGGGLPTTHRIVADGVSRGEVTFTTKGDANASEDEVPVRQSEVIGQVLFAVPYLGYVLDFARQPLGFLLLIGIPASLVMVEEVTKLWRAFRGRREPDATTSASHESV